MRPGVLSAMVLGLVLAACAEPMATVQPQDQFSDCTMIRAEIEANSAKTKQLADEHSLAALQARQEYLTQLATERCRPGYRPRPHPPAVYVAPAPEQ